MKYFRQLLCDANGKRTLRRNVTSVCSFISVVLPRRGLIVFKYMYVVAVYISKIVESMLAG